MTSLAVRSELTTVWPSLVPSLFLSEVDNDNADYRRGLPATWAVLRYPNSTETQISIGAPGQNCWRETGIIVFRVYTKSGGGSLPALALCETVKAAFRQYVGLAGYFVINTISPPVDLSDGESQGEWYGAQVEATYTYEYHQ